MPDLMQRMLQLAEETGTPWNTLLSRVFPSIKVNEDRHIKPDPASNYMQYCIKRQARIRNLSFLRLEESLLAFIKPQKESG